MKRLRLVIVGAGEVGGYLAALLSSRGHEVTVIEASDVIARRVDEEYNVRVVPGNGASASVLEKAEAGRCHCFLAMTRDDKTNVIACSLAKALGAATTICRIHEQTYADTSLVNYQLHFGLDHLISPEALCAVELAKVIRNPGRVAVENFARGQIEVRQVRLRKGSRLIGKSLREIRIGSGVRVGYVQRDGEESIPTAETTLQEGDDITLFGLPEKLYETRKTFDPEISTQLNRVVLFGGGEIALALIRHLGSPRFRLRIFERDKEKCESLSRTFPQVTIIHGDGTSLRLMEEEQIGEADYFIACTKDDENNIVTCLQASKLGTSHVHAVINKTDYDDVLDTLKRALGVELIVSPRLATANEVLRLISTDDYLELARLPKQQSKILEFPVAEKSPIVDKTIREIEWPTHCIVVALQHKFQASLPGPDEKVLSGDRLVIITRDENIRALLKLFRAR